MHRHETLNDLFEVLPFLLVRVVVAVSIHFEWESLQGDLHVATLNCLHCNVLVVQRVLYNHDAFRESWLVLIDDVGWQHRTS